ATEGSPMANKVAHAVWGAVEAYSANQNAAAGAGGALAGEVMADVIAKELYGKKPNQLNRGEKEVVSSVSQAAGALVGGAAANSSQGIGVGLTTTKNAVENNYLSKDDWDNYRKDLQNCQGNKQCQMDINKKYAKLDSEKHADLVAACKLGGSSSKCQTMSEEARDGVDYAVQEFYKPMFDGRNELWLRQRIEQGYSDSKKEPSVALLGDESLNNLNDMAKNPKVLKKLKSDENLRKEFIDAVDESTLAVRMEKSNAYEFGEGLSKYKNLVDLTDLTGGYKYFNREIPLESVYPEAFIAPFALRGAQAISSAEGLIVQGTSKVLPRVGMVAEKYPLLSELVVSGVINTGYQLSSKKEFSGDDLLKAELSTLFNRNKSLGQQTAINIGLNVMATTKPEDYGWNAISAVTGTLGSAAVSNGLSKVNISPSINKMVVPTGSAITSEYLGDAEKLKQYYRFLEEKYAK
ncbi:MAG: VENN motif pre-toxin domain-containing protein, partial [Haemophilus parainfluenzae]|nr:VENN motif pre-toxin domain-containing protein [Haemophilus parainfluenzae]MDU4784120.1 VENN motif pre-toxin domain-containing protein [Haemophilus parainfluenzae]